MKPTAKPGNSNGTMEKMEGEVHWGALGADKVLEKFPNVDEYICAAGISPSGTIHFGNFRDVVTAFAIAKELGKRGKNSKLIFSWDDYDRLRKVPRDIDSSFEQYIGMPLADIPSPDGKAESYARYQEQQFEKAIKDLGIPIEYRYQSQEYRSGRYDDLIVLALQKRHEIADILYSFMTEKGKVAKGIDEKDYKENYYPITVYSRLSGKDNTKVTNYDGESTITYQCFDTDKTDTVDLRSNRIAKLSWKVDWPMRWAKEGVTFEPGGKDHSSPGGSYDTSSVIAKKIFNIEPPVFQGYEFVGLRGLSGKMSGSKGESISPSQLLEIYTPELLKWLYFKTEPTKSFNLAFDDEVYRQYSQFDNLLAKAKKSYGEIGSFNQSVLELSGVTEEQLKKKPPIPFKQAVNFGQVIQWNEEKLRTVLEALEFDYDPDSVKERLIKAKAWLETYNPSEMISLRETPNSEYAQTLSEEQREQISLLKVALEKHPDQTIQELNHLVYEIPKQADLDMKENAKRQREFFITVYNLLVSRNDGPRLATLLWAIEDKKRIIDLLEV